MNKVQSNFGKDTSDRKTEKSELGVFNILALAVIAIVVLAMAIFMLNGDDSKNVDGSGTEGGIHWVYDSGSRVLTIEATDSPEPGYSSGEMKNYTSSRPGWESIMGNGTKLDIREGVNAIGDTAFEYNKKISGELKFPSTLTKIGNGAFYKCINLKGSLTIPDSTNHIGGAAFSGCMGFNGDMTIGDGLESLGGTIVADTGFTGKLYIGSGLKEFNQSSVDYAYFSAIVVSEENNVFSSGTDGILYSKDGTTLWRCPLGKSGNLTIPDNVTTIKHSAFIHCSRLVGDLIIGDNVQIIEPNAFVYCTGFDGSLHIGNGLQKIDGTVFQDVSGLTGTIFIGKNVQEILFTAFDNTGGIEFVVHGDNQYFTTYKGLLCDKAMNKVIKCPLLKAGTIDLPTETRTIGYQAFLNCSKLTGSLTLNNIVVNPNAFHGCSGLNGILTLSGTTTIGPSSFMNCNNLTGVHIGAGVSMSDPEANPFGNTGGKAFVVDTNNSTFKAVDGILCSKDGTRLYCCPTGKVLANYVIPDNVKIMMNASFYGCVNVTGTITIGKEVTQIRSDSISGAVFGCSGIDNILVSADNAKFVSKNGCLYMKDDDHTLVCCPPMKTGEIDINDVMDIKEGAFIGCKGLTKIVMPTECQIYGETFFGITFYAADGATVLEPTEENLLGNTFIGTCTHMVLYKEGTYGNDVIVGIIIAIILLAMLLFILFAREEWN